MTQGNSEEPSAEEEPSARQEPSAEAAHDLWLFGYGSIIWKPDFPFLERRVGYVRNWSRRFWQGSTDHRGVPAAPGRVVTLVESEHSVCGGMAYRLPATELENILDALDHREKDGYEREFLPIHLGGESGDEVSGFTYRAGERNPNFLGDAPAQDIAAQIMASHGPSGSNKAYILELDSALRELEIADPHVHELAALVRSWPDNGNITV